MGAPTTCAGCHEDPHEAALGTDCSGCHTTTAFRPASGFDHQATAFPLTDKHKEVACAACHRPAASGRVDYEVRDHANCASCHTDPHRGRTALSACSDCHTTAGWDRVQGLPPAHSPAGWPLVGKHVGVACVDCHGAALDARVDRACASCHQDPHAGRFGATCESCHDERGWNRLNTAAFDHTRTRYPLEGAHRRVTCESCHRQGKRKVYRGLAFDRCDRCHSDYHQAALATVASPTDCEGCHEVADFTPAVFTAADHARARFPLAGSHLAVPCTSCHQRQPPAPTPLVTGQSRCVDCHSDPHAGSFDARMAADPTAGCRTCHDPAGWKQGSFDHDRTAFPLRGVHASAACASCHTEAPARYTGAPTACDGCHADVHLGQFQAGAASPRACDDCHQPTAWPITPFDHAVVADWPLAGRHAPLDCAACHPIRAADAAHAEIVQYRLGYRACADCHENPHRPHTPSLARPAPNPAVPDIGGDCARCHVPTDWATVPAQVAFDHAATGFPLAGRHATQSCAACHGPGLRVADADRACASCHADPHRGELGASCEGCHDARGWEPSRPHLRHRDTRFPLAGAHAATDCTSCHRQQREDSWRAVPLDCYGCHAADYRRPDIHPNHVAAAFDTTCDTCHSQATFYPARLRHDLFWPLRGAHASADCFSCHAGDRYGGTPRECIGCHEGDYAAALDPPHAAYGMSQRCESCHSEVAWDPARGTWHDSVFPISRGDHRGFGCADCHFAGTPPANFTCIGCHTRATTDGEHDDVGGYVWENFACYACHPTGEE